MQYLCVTPCGAVWVGSWGGLMEKRAAALCSLLREWLISLAASALSYTNMLCSSVCLFVFSIKILLLVAIGKILSTSCQCYLSILMPIFKEINKSTSLSSKRDMQKRSWLVALTPSRYYNAGQKRVMIRVWLLGAQQRFSTGFRLGA